MDPANSCVLVLLVLVVSSGGISPKIIARQSQTTQVVKNGKIQRYSEMKIARTRRQMAVPQGYSCNPFESYTVWWPASCQYVWFSYSDQEHCVKVHTLPYWCYVSSPLCTNYPGDRQYENEQPSAHRSSITTTTPDLSSREISVIAVLEGRIMNKGQDIIGSHFSKPKSAVSSIGDRQSRMEKPSASPTSNTTTPAPSSEESTDQGIMDRQFVSRFSKLNSISSQTDKDMDNNGNKTNTRRKEMAMERKLLVTMDIANDEAVITTTESEVSKISGNQTTAAPKIAESAKDIPASQKDNKN